ncbi:unnamed protein product [Vitrella brassicaformis CCMP3155]|uniref:Cadherin-like beta-sandwich-like domain-containing protein n=1 Tax=Vitrella brassicaformis (strain CCMP3155) TaxID=1169540 RepID=A0A0G4EWB1_VITBC|nr:unnamed protein product [Vitrella brassicaformis CCMP3155]|eukprot:CEM02538.1 unnamed protein product [Vitrella brassicaformis CCMP3155]
MRAAAQEVPPWYIWLVLSLIAVLAHGDDVPRLASITVRYSDQPIDLIPPFDPDIFAYTAFLDYSVPSCRVEPRAASSSDVVEHPTADIQVARGGEQIVTVVAALSGEESVRQPYKLTIKRMIGTETALKGLKMGSALTLAPPFDPQTREYAVAVPLGDDAVSVFYQPSDVGQYIEVDSYPQQPTTRRRLQLYRASPPVSRGEEQHKFVEGQFPIDLGMTRRILIRIQSAGPAKSTSTYTVTLSRPQCPDKRPLFDPEKRRCFDSCNEGYFSDPDTNRCEQCNVFCRRCTSILDCLACYRDDDDYTYALSPKGDGSCRRAVRHVADEYQWVIVPLAILLVVLVMVGLFGFLFFFMRWRKRQIWEQYYEDDDEEELLDYYPDHRDAVALASG